MYKLTLKDIINFTSNNFEIFAYINIALLLMGILLFCVLKAAEPAFKKRLFFFINKVMFVCVLVGEIVLLALMAKVFWANYQKPPEEIITEVNILPDTHWVKDNFLIHYIDDNKFCSIQLDGGSKKTIFTADSPIKEYHFSPDGNNALIASQKSLVLINLNEDKSILIDSIDDASKADHVNGSIGQIHWSPDSLKFCYEASRWTKFSSQDNLYVYDIIANQKRSIRNVGRKISSLFWDQQGENLYYLKHEMGDPQQSAYTYQVKVFKISLVDLVANFLTTIASDEAQLPIDHLSVRGVDLFLSADQLSFSHIKSKEILVSRKGHTIGIDKQDCLYLTEKQWFRKRLFKIPRKPYVSDFPRYQYEGGELVIDNIKWIPSGEYLIMDHRYLGALVLNPFSGKIGHLVELNGHTHGWYSQLN